MGAAPPKMRSTVEDFLAWEATQLERSELVAGEIYAMAEAGETVRLDSVGLDLPAETLFAELEPREPDSDGVGSST